MWGRIDSTGKIRFDADNGCVAVGLLAPTLSYWTGAANVTGCREGELNGRFELTVTGGKPHLSLKLSSMRYTAGLGSPIDTYEATGTFTRYNPLGAAAGQPTNMQGAALKGEALGHRGLSNGISASYEWRVKASVMQNIRRAGGEKPVVSSVVEITSTPDGTLERVRMVRTSGNEAWDREVMEGVGKTVKVPRDVDGRVPRSMVLEFAWQQ